MRLFAAINVEAVVIFAIVLSITLGVTYWASQRMSGATTFYAAGRQMSPDALQTWMEAFARHLPETRPLVWLDLGSGVGRMTPSLASAFGGPVHGVEPSAKMRAQALAHAGHPAVRYAAGSAEHIPLPDASCDAALLFFVWHHVVDREGAAQELRRVGWW